MKTCILTLFLLATCFAKAQIVSDYVTAQNPGSIETDSHGNLWVNYRINSAVDTFYLSKITPAGDVITVIKEPFELDAFGVNDNFIWISSTPNGIVYKYSHAGVRLDSVNVNSPTEILLDADGTWYVSECQSGRLLKHTPANVQTVLVSGFPLDNNNGLTRDENGSFYTCNRFDGSVIKIDPETGSKIVIAALPTTSPYSLGYMTYNNGYVYVASGLNCIYRVDTAGVSFEVFAGSEGMAGDVCGNIGSSMFDAPMGTAFSLTGDTLFVSDANTHKIKAISGMSALSTPENDPNNFLSAYPNPSENVVQLRTSGDPLTDLSVTDANGKALDVSLSITGNETALDISALVKGTYFVRGVTETGKVYRSVFIKV